MQHREYLDLDLVIEAAAGAAQGSYQARVTKSPCGLEAESPFSVPFTDEELADFVAAVTPGGLTRRLAPTIAVAPPTVDVRTMGKRLFGAAFAGDLAKCLVESVKTARNDHNKGVRVRLHLGSAPELGGIPWEFLFSDFLDRYVALSSDTPVVRYLDVPAALAPLPVTLPLRVVVMVSDPIDAPGLDVKRETDLLQATTGDLQKSGLLSLEFLDAATLSNLQHRLYEPMHVFHFIGHGAFDVALGQGTLLFEDDQRRAHPVSATRLATLLHDAQDLRLAVLNSCEGARGSSTDPFSGVAQTLLRQGLPSAVAMQSEISDRAAIAFAHEFYFALCRGAPVDAATSEGRKAVFTSGNDVEWGTPVLFLRSEDARLFEVAEEPDEPSREEHWDSLYDAAQSALAAKDTTRARSLLEQLASESPDYKDVTALLPRIREPVAVAPTVPAPRPPVPQDLGGLPPARPVPAPQPVWGQPPPTPPPPIGWQQPPRPQPPRPQPPGPQPPGPQPPKRHHRLRTTVLVLIVVSIVLGALYAYGASLEEGDLTATELVVTPTIDGQLTGDEWSGVDPVSSDNVILSADGTSAVRAQWRLGWTSEALYVLATVSDPTPVFVNSADPGALSNGDSVGFEMGSDPSDVPDNASLRPSDVFVLLAPGANSSGAVAAGAIPGPTQGRPDIASFQRPTAAPGITVRAVVGSSGYQVEAEIPWRVLGFVPAANRLFGFNLDVFDAAGRGTRQSIVSSNPDRSKAQHLPAIWDTLELKPRG